jgi:hypothetical protein
MNADGTPRGSRALRAQDGLAVQMPDFASLYPKRLRTLGGRLLASETDAQGDVVVRLYDVASGKDLWKQTFTAGSVVLRSEDPNLAGAVEPNNNGKVTVYDLRTSQKVLDAQMEPKDLEKVQDVRLLVDAERYYLACNRTSDPQEKNRLGRGPYPTVANGIRCLPANGPIYAFPRIGGKRIWKVESPNLLLVVDQFRELPVLVLTAWHQDFNARINPMTTKTQVIAKHTGKLILDKTEAIRNINQPFHTLRFNVAAGTVELIGYQNKIVMYQEK